MRRTSTALSAALGGSVWTPTNATSTVKAATSRGLQMTHSPTTHLTLLAAAYLSKERHKATLMVRISAQLALLERVTAVLTADGVGPLTPPISGYQRKACAVASLKTSS